METTIHYQEGSLPKKMVNWPLNLEAARQLADKYDNLAETGGLKNHDELAQVTGFGTTEACTLCAAARNNRLYCIRCLYYNGDSISCVEGESCPTYMGLSKYPNPENLRARASFIRSVINKFE